MQVIVKVKIWDMEGDYYIGTPSAKIVPSGLVDNKLLATRFGLCNLAWAAFAALKGLGNVESASLVEV